MSAGARRVTIFGGGIAGLTAAHELADRGFSVQLVERASDPDDHGRPQIAIGGLARTQLRRVPLPVSRARLDAAARGEAPPVEAGPRDLPSVHAIGLAPSGEGGLAPTPEGQATLARLAEHLAGPLAAYAVRVDGDAAAAAAVASLLVEAGVSQGRIALGDGSRAASVEVRLVEGLVPGEHGFRFFPAFYRHLADTMKRTPVGEHRAYDHLVAVDAQLYTRPGHPPAALRRRPRASFEEMRRELAAWLRAVGFTPRDVGLYALRLLRFVTSSPRRRAGQYEALSWWDFVTLRRLDGASPGERLPYSERALGFLRHAPRALVAMDPVSSDARTQGNILVQLLRDPIRAEGPIDAALDGPTSPAWLTPWRRHLEQLGVRFFHGRLVELAPPPDGGPLRVEPVVEEVSPGGLDGFDPGADYLVIALDLVGAQRATQRLAEWGRRRGVDVGVPEAVQGFALEAPEPGGAAPRARDPETETGAGPWDRLQTLTGVQLCFGQRIELARGYVYYTESPWALTSVGQSFRSGHAPSLAHDGYLALHSVDLGEIDRSAWRLTKAQMVAEVMRQVRAGVAGAGPDVLPEPLWYHVDEGLEFAGADGPLRRNRTPYLINVAGDWARRPGAEPADPRRGAPVAPPLRTPALWQPAHGGHAVHFEQVVFAGTYLRTFTRLTSMESANESARHAVNAILAHAEARLAGERGPASPAPCPEGARPSTRLGDFCEVWDPEESDAGELDFLRAVDATLAERGLPHLFDILDFDELPGALAPDEPDPLRAVLRHLADVLDRELELDGGAAPSSALRRLMGLIREQIG
jgi:hypothetical protein